MCDMVVEFYRKEVCYIVDLWVWWFGNNYVIGLVMGCEEGFGIVDMDGIMWIGIGDLI